MKKGCIYLITCRVNNKKYVGQHCAEDPQKRWNAHLSEAKKGSTLRLHRALIKYAPDNFDFDVIYTGPVESLNVMELYYAEKYKTYIWDDDPGGYNMKMCGNFEFGVTVDINKVKEYINIDADSDIDNAREIALQRRISLYGLS